jgi:dUTP pyrophosphatase
MDLNQLKKSAIEIGKVAAAMVEEKLGDRSQMEEQVRVVAKQVESVVSEVVKQGVTNVKAGFASSNFAKERASGFAGAAAEKPVLKFKKLAHFRGELPAYQTPGSSGLDVRARIDEAIVLQPGARILIPTGLSMEIPLGYEVQARPRSGLAITKGISLVNTPGTIDADYRGELKIILINLGQEAVTIQDQERIAQLVVAPVVQPEIELAEDLSETERGAGGFGSTGV